MAVCQIYNRLKLIGEISKASNSQTRVDESDRRSNDELQLKLQSVFFEKYGLYYERKRGEFSDGLYAAYLESNLIINREKLIRVSLATEWRVNQARSNIEQFFKGDALAQLLRTSDVQKYAFGYECLRRLNMERKAKPRIKADRYHTRRFGQALRYGQYAVVAVCVNRGLPRGCVEEEAVLKVLQKWKSFENWAKKRRANIGYRLGTSFDFVNYYKGRTINSDLQKFKFAL